MSATVPQHVTFFTIVHERHPTKGDGYTAVWLTQSGERTQRNAALDWRRTKEEVRRSMSVLYADVEEWHGEVRSASQERPLW